MEIERKWLFNMQLVPTDESETITYYEQTYLSVEPEVRIRSKHVDTNPANWKHANVACMSETYMLCIKGNGGISRVEVQKELSESEFEELKQVGNIQDTDFIKKKYYKILVEGNLLTVGTVNEGTPYQFSYGKIEFKSEEEANKFKAPSWFGREVTTDSRYKMKNYWLSWKESSQKDSEEAKMKFWDEFQ